MGSHRNGGINIIMELCIGVGGLIWLYRGFWDLGLEISGFWKYLRGNLEVNILQETAFCDHGGNEYFP